MHRHLDSTITGGCVDQALTSGTPDFDSTCGGERDVPIPDFTVGRYNVNLAITYGGPTVTPTNDSGLIVKIPYNNSGTDLADGVTVTIMPPTGVTVERAQVLLKVTTAGASISATTESSAQDISCAAPVNGKVDCSGPDAEAEVGSQLWLTLKVAGTTKSGTWPMKVTSSPCCWWWPARARWRRATPATAPATSAGGGCRCVTN